MRTDLKLNYGDLDAIKSKLERYEKVIETLQDSAIDLKGCLKGQESYAIKELSAKLGTIDKDLKFQSKRVGKLKKVLSRYVSSMEGIISARSRDSRIRIDSVDVWANIEQIEWASNSLSQNFSRGVSSDWGRSFSEEEIDEQHRQERNYNKLSNAQKYTLATLATAVKEKVAEIRKLYEGPIKSYETKDDELRRSLDEQYNSITTERERSKNRWRLFGRIASAFLKAFVVAFMVAAVIATLPAWAGGVIFVGGVVAGAICSQVPEGEMSLESFWEAAKKVGERSLDNPLYVVGCMGQGLMDRTQTPEGIASVAGGIAGGIAGNSFGRNTLKPKVNEAIAKYKAKVASGGKGIGAKAPKKPVVKPKNEVPKIKSPKGKGTGGGDNVKKPYSNSRPSYDKTQVDDVWNAAKDANGKVYDPTGKEIKWDTTQPRNGQWDMGHIPGQKYSDVHQQYMNGNISKGEFLEWYRNPDNYRPELPSTNRGHLFE